MTYHPTPDIHVYIDQATAVFKARVDLPGGATYPVTSLPFKNVTLGNWADVQADMTLLLGSADGLDDLGRVRVQNILTSTTIPVGRVSRGLEDGQATISDNAYITILDDYRVWSKLPYETLTDPPTSYKDSDVPVEVGGQNYNIEIPPVAIMGTAFAGYIDSVTGKLRVAFDGSLSYAMADGATITAWGWVIPGSATIVSGAIDASTLTVDFEPGFYWVQLSVTDSNGKGHSTRRPVLAVDPANDVTLQHAAIESQRFTPAGQTLTLRLYGDAPRTTYPDGALVMVWFNAPSSPADRSHIKFVGWIQSESWGIRSTPRGVVRDTLLTCLDVAGRLDTLPGFPQALERNDEEALWAYMPGLHISRALHYLLHWHSTALVVADFFLPANGDDYTAMRLDSTGATLYDQTHERALSMVPDHYLTCNPQGQMAVVEDWMLIDEGDRPAASVILTEDDLSDIRADYTRPPKVYALRSSAVVVSTDWQYDAFGEETLPLAFSVAPHTDAGAFGQGANEVTTGEKLTISQTALNVCEGHRYARLNSRDGLYQITPAHVDDVWSLIPALFARVQINVGAAYAAQRGLPWTQAVGMVKELTLRYQATREGLVLTPTFTFERETSGPPAITMTPPEAGESEYEVPPPPVPTVPPPMLSEGQERVVGIDLNGNIYRTSDFQTPSGSGGPTWAEVSTGISETLYSWVVDPFSPGYAPGATSGSIDGWVASEDAIYKLANLFGSLTVEEVHSFATPAVAASFHWRTIQASFGAYFAEGVNPWLLCVSYYGDTTGHEGTWATHSLDGGVTWSAEVQISAHYDTGTPVRFTPIGVYASPKTPGFAYTAAHTTTADPGAIEGFVSEDWGASWSAASFIDPANNAAGTIHVPWPDNASETVAYHGALSTAVVEGTDEALMPVMAYFNFDNVVTILGPSPTGSLFLTAYQEEPPSAASVRERNRLVIAPPPTTKRMEVTLNWFAYRNKSGGSSSTASSLTSLKHTLVDQDGNDTYSQPAYGSSASGSDNITYTYAFGDFPTNNVSIYSSPPTAVNQLGVYYIIDIIANAVGSGTFAEHTINIIATVTEIELDDSTIYTPVSASGSRAFRLKSLAGFVQSDISPSDGTRLYGVHRGSFGVRSYDSDRQYLLAAVMGNDTSTDPDDDFHAVYISDDFGATWAEVVAPIADSVAPAGRPAFEAAFGGDSEQIVYIWGPAEYISYSDDFGVTVDDRSGNLGALGCQGFIGIAGGVS